ncbi:hypothetical protein BST97_03965 [Nonlabens spongiae]|uniref:Uncharacterized protein n=1 Tax=Nonlabens spongiae TaxID=331648 RepID=A0A1W6MP51_9FLAO|nr:hypothetical protein [Nonlabens spongiae]ARN79365.1 hypothetical protein BST97_03965 [Nonlabens spongiae]
MEDLKTLKFEAQKCLNASLSHMSTNDRVAASREANRFVLALNKIYKKSNFQAIMDLLKELTIKKRKIEVRMKGRMSA